jgi:lambda family phage tail tape measure protein
MAIDVSQLTVKVISEGIDKATESLNKLADASSRVESSTLIVKTATEASDQSVSKVTKTTSSYIDRLRTKVDLLGKDTAQTAAYIAAQKGLSSSDIALASSLGAQIDAFKARTKEVREAEAAEKALQATQARGNALNLAGQRAAEWKKLGEAQAEALRMNKEYDLFSAAHEEALAMNAALDESSKRYKQIAVDAIARGQAQNLEIQATRLASNEVSKATSYSNDLAKSQSAQMASATKLDGIQKSLVNTTKMKSTAQAEDAASISALLQSIDPLERKLAKLDATERLLTSAFKAGKVDADVYAAALSKISLARDTTSEKQLENVAKNASTAGEALKAFSLKSVMAQRELMVMGREIARGDWTRFVGSASIFVDRAGLMNAALLALKSPVTAVVAALAGLAIAAEVGANESNKFNQALILTGNYAGITTAQMQSFAQGMKDISGQHAAAQALTEVANTGRFAGDQVVLVGKAALQMEKMTGQAVEKTIKQFEDLSKSPVEAIYKLDEQYHFLTADVYEQIRALDEQGKHQEASDLAMKTYADTIDKRSPQILENLGYIEKGWAAIKKIMVDVVNSAEGLGRTKSLEDQKKVLEGMLSSSKIKDVSAFGPSDSEVRKEIQSKLDVINEAIRMANRAATETAENTRIQSAGKEALKGIDDHLEKMKGEIRLQKEINEITQRYINLRKAEQNAPSKAYEDKLAGVTFDEKGNPSGGLFQQEVEDAKRKNKIASPRTNEYGIDAALQANKNKIQEVADGLRESLDRIKSQYNRGEIDTETYLRNEFLRKDEAYAKEYDLAEKNLEIAKGKKNVAAVEKAEKEIKKIQDEAYLNTSQYIESLNTLDKKRQDNVKKLTDSLVAEYNARQEEIDNTLNSSGLGAKAQDALARELQARRAFNTEMKRLDAELLKGEQHGGINTDTYNKETEVLRQNLEKRLAQERKFSSDKLEAEANWTNGAKRALNDYQESANNVAAQTQNVFADGFKGMEDALTTFITTGKLSFGSLVQSILNGMARIEARRFLSSLMGGSSGGGFLGPLLSLGITAFGGYGASAGLSGDAATIANGVAEAGGIPNYYADGGDPPVNQPSIVGERGPELFVPKQAGTIIPNEKLGGNSTQITYSPVINIDSRSDRAQVMQDVQNSIKAGHAQLLDDLRRRRIIT